MSMSPCRAVKPDTALSNTAALIAGNILRLREERQMTAAILALRTGWSMARIEAVEAGAADSLLLDDIDVLTKALLVSPAELFA